jgi:prepilin-type N-terminal cleavage/methylation domain-containing protein
MKRINKKQSGFTLLELLVVVAILAIIAGSVISSISGQEERAGQGVALHTMGALENATQQHIVIADGLPSALDSLLCADVSAAGAATTAGVTGATLFGALSGDVATDNDTDFDGGLAPGLIGDATVTGNGKLINATLQGVDGVTITEDEDSMVAGLFNAGMTSLRYAEVEACDPDDGDVVSVGGDVTVAAADEGLPEVLGNTIFWDAAQGGFGVNSVIDPTADLEVAILKEPVEIGQEDGDVIAVFGVGNFSSFRDNDILSRGPVDGNVAGDGQYYSHFSLAIKIGEDATSTGDGAAVDVQVVENAGTAVPVEPTIVAVLDSDGDGFDDEIAEFNGLEDE